MAPEDHDIDVETSEPLISESSEVNVDNTRKPSKLKYVALGSAFALMLFVGVVQQQSKSQKTMSAAPSHLASLQSIDMRTFSVTNEEIQTYGPTGGDYPWMDGFLLEPYTETTFYSSEAGDWQVGDSDDDTNDNGDDDTSTAISSNQFKFTFQEVGQYTITYKSSISSNEETVNIYVKYVRREIHSLTDAKKAAFKDAFVKVIETRDEVVGHELYGDAFTPFSKLAALHTNWAGAEDCDHIHDGMGFVTTHVQMARILEMSLQAVNPAVSLPYWEYTKDVEHINTEHNGDFTHWKDIDVWSDEYFGETDFNTAQIETGAYSIITSEADSKFSTVVNAYGLMRAPWNTLGNLKPTRYFGGGGESAMKVSGDIVASYAGMSSCSNLYDFISESTTMYSFTAKAEGLIHGPMHLLTGGFAGTPEIIEFARDQLGVSATYPGFTEIWSFLGEFFAIVSRAVYRNKLLSCPEAGSCLVGITAQEDCTCTCDSSEVIKKMRDSTLTTYGFTHQLNDMLLQKLMDYFCAGGSVLGDQASASAATDPSFASIHGTVERYMQLLRLTQKFTDESWPSREDSLFSTQSHPYSKYCIGHYEDNMLLFGTIDGNKFTNIEYYSYLDPKKDKLPYVYDHFNFDHCADLGYDIKAAAQP